MACLWAWERIGIALVQATDEPAISQRSPGSEKSMPGLLLRDTGCVRRRGNTYEMPNPTKPVESGSGVKLEGAWHFSATSVQKCPVMLRRVG